MVLVCALLLDHEDEMINHDANFFQVETYLFKRRSFPIKARPLGPKQFHTNAQMNACTQDWL